MGSTLNGLMNIAQQSIYNNQVALNVISNNIANMNTKGYTRLNLQLFPDTEFSTGVQTTVK